MIGDEPTVPADVVIAGTVGAVVSSVITTAGEDAADVFIPSDAVAVNELSPSDSGTSKSCQSPAPSTSAVVP